MSIQLTPEQMAEIKRLVKMAGGSVIFPKPKGETGKTGKPKYGKSAVSRRAFWHAHPSYVCKPRPFIPGLSGYKWLSGREIHEYHNSLGAIRPLPRTLLLTYNKRRAWARAKLAA